VTRYVVINVRSHPTRIHWWRVIVIALGALILSGCQSMAPYDNGALLGGGLADGLNRLPPVDRAMAPVVVPESGQSVEFGPNCYSETFSDAESTSRQWPCGPDCDAMIVQGAGRMPTLSPDEYLCDGGDGLYTNYVGLSEERGLEPTDTVAQYETEDGGSHVVASNRICVYAPRFAATRRISRLENREMVARVGGLHEDVVADAQVVGSRAINVRRNLAAEGQIGTTMKQELYEATRGLLVDDVDVVWEWGRRMLPFENVHAVGTVEFDGGQRAMLAQAASAANEWNSIEAVELAIDGRPAQMVARVGKPSSLTVYETSADSRLQLVKLASTGAAEPGETVHFTIRFDNVGDRPISNIKIVDSLATRLEYIAASQECTLRAIFAARDNVAGSEKLEWEVREELMPGEGGVIRFQCRVR
jgi:uncharacterized repeat protein (TIGR01451 family)